MGNCFHSCHIHLHPNEIFDVVDDKTCKIVKSMIIFEKELFKEEIKNILDKILVHEQSNYVFKEFWNYCEDEFKKLH